MSDKTKKSKPPEKEESKAPAKTAREAPSKTSSTRGKNTEWFDPVLAMELLRRTSVLLDEREKELQTLTDFHRALEGSKNDDLRICWDVRIVRGADTPFHSVSGVSSLPGILSAKMKSLAPHLIEQEVHDKIAQPLTAVFMTEAETQNGITQALLGPPKLPGSAFSPVSYEGGDDDDVMRIAREIEDHQDSEEDEDDA